MKHKVPLFPDITDSDNPILDFFPGHLYWFAKNGIILGCNLACAKFFGYADIQSVIGENVYAIVAKGVTTFDDLQTFKQDNEKVCQGEQVITEEMVTKAQETYTYISYKFPLKNKAGEVVGVIGASFDVTAQKKLHKSSLSAAQALQNQILNSQKNANVTALKNKGAKVQDKILLIQGSLIAQKALQRNLQSWGAKQVDAAHTPAQVVDKITRRQYDMIYLDLLPGSDPAKMIKQIKSKRSLNQDTPIIGLTVHRNSELEESYKKLGIQQILVQPITEMDAQKMPEQLYPNAVETDLPLVDWPLWLKRCGGHQDLVQQAWEITMNLLPEFKEKSTQALAEKDYAKLDEVVHKCHGGLKYCGLPALEAATFAFEKGIRSKDYAKLDELYKKFIAQIDLALALEWEQVSS